MLDEILRQIENGRGPMTVRELARRLDVEETALAGMLEFLQMKGKLSVYRPGEREECGPAACTTCVFGGSCLKSDEE